MVKDCGLIVVRFSVAAAMRAAVLIQPSIQCAVVPKADIGKGKRVWCRAGNGVFAGMEQEKKSQPD
jgi:hypothetical protein